jgi:DNA polymerase lambda/DNA polymerase IV
MPSPTLEEKLAIFEKLEALNGEDSDDDYGNNKRETEYREKSRAFFTHANGPKGQAVPSTLQETRSQSVNETPIHDLRSHPARRTVSAPALGDEEETPRPKVIKSTPLLRKAVTAAQDSVNLRAEQGVGTSFVEDTPVPNVMRAKNPPPLQRGSTYPGQPSARGEQSPSASSTMKKRKRTSSSSTKVVPEAEQIFRGMAFYYIPDNDVAPIRKIRIGRAQGYGGQWIRTLHGATHVVVDKNLTYKDIENVVAKAGGPLPVIVNEDYPIDCIAFRSLLNPGQQRYRVAGCPLSTQNKVSSPSEAQQRSQSSDLSLVVQKHPSRMNAKPSDGTPPRGEQSSIRSGGNEQGQLTTSSQIFEEPASLEEENVSQPSATQPSTNGSQQTGKQQPGTLNRQNTVNDELSEYISLIQQYKDLPLDDDEDDLQSTKGSHEPVSDVEAGSDSDSTSSRTSKRRKGKRSTRSGTKNITFEERFACHQGGTKDNPLSSGSTNPNARTIEVLQSMCDYYSRTNDHWRTTAYRKAISTLRRQTTKISTEAEAYRLPTIGSRLAAKIEEIATTDRLRRLECAADDPLTPVLETFLKIYDVGVATARKWISQGYRTLDDLVAKADLSANQRIGIGRYEDLNTRIPRAEVEVLARYVRRAARELDPDVELLVGGSYRRGADSSGDIDFIVTKKGTSSTNDLAPFLEELVRRLTEEGFLVAALAAHRPGSRSGGGSQWHGCCVLPVREGRAALGGGFRPLWRRIDFLLVPETEYGAALIYFTGNDIFNRSMRLLASRKGMRLNQRGLYKEVMRGPGRIKVTEGELVEGRDEKRIFEILGVKWREPRERWC